MGKNSKWGSQKGINQIERGESDPFTHFVSVLYSRHSSFEDHPPSPYLNNGRGVPLCRTSSEYFMYVQFTSRVQGDIVQLIFQIESFSLNTLI